ncbi:MAG: diguanylate cyclase [Calditrichaeota bacterium]|nr:MAG: diguanylate cyclase [Calditrichota bacterium]
MEKSPPQALRPVKILYIEDEPLSRDLVRRILPPEEFEVYEASDGMTGLQTAQEILPELILMDIHLPDISGTELATKIKNLPQLQETVIVAITGVGEAQAREMSLVAGCDGYITKPIDVHRFPEQLREFLAGKREEVDARSREAIRRRYEAVLVDHLTEKVKELQTTNQLLQSRTNKLKDYSQKLEIVLQIIHRLQLCRSPESLRKQLVEEIYNSFGFPRCALLEVDPEKLALRPRYACGFKQQQWKRFALPYQAPVFQQLFEDQQVVFFANVESIPDKKIQAMLRKYHTRQFIFGLLGIPANQAQQFSIQEDLQGMLDHLIPDSPLQNSTTVGMNREYLEQYLSSETLYVGGYLFLDYAEETRRIGRYDIRILEMLLQTVGLLYQNLKLRETLQHLFVRAEKDAITDHLTGLFNLRYFTEQLRREFSRARRHQSSIALLMLDIDFFKKYNDTYGHQAGDRVLQKVAALLSENTRSSDFVARYGGEEFVIICPELSRKEGEQLAQKLCRIIEEAPFPGEEKLPQKRVTISIGVAAFPEDAQEPEELIHQADQALYTAKARGRNRVELASPD